MVHDRWAEIFQFICVYLKWLEVLRQNEPKVGSLWEFTDDCQASGLHAAEPTQQFKVRNWYNYLMEASYIKNINYSPSYCSNAHHNGHSCLYHIFPSFICFIQLTPKIFLSAMVLSLTISICWKTWLTSNIGKFTISLNKLLQLLHRRAHFIALSIWPDWTFKHCTFVCLYYWNLRAVICLVIHSLRYVPYWFLKS